MKIIEVSEGGLLSAIAAAIGARLAERHGVTAEDLAVLSLSAVKQFAVKEKVHSPLPAGVKDLLRRAMANLLESASLPREQLEQVAIALSDDGRVGWSVLCPGCGETGGGLSFEEASFCVFCGRPLSRPPEKK